MPLWIFAYGSLLWRAGFPFERRAAAVIAGWERRLDQGSPDHRGTPERLGRVATLVPVVGGRCAGAVYLVKDEDRASVLAALDHRERGGYDRVEVEAALTDEGGATVAAVTWVASSENPFHLGRADLETMAAQIRAASGPSGTNRDYVLALAEALRTLGAVDREIAMLSAILRDAE
ncbi:MAG: gamma-glutamylcyclotransferase [Polyangiaceae bacterium]